MQLTAVGLRSLGACFSLVGQSLLWLSHRISSIRMLEEAELQLELLGDGSPCLN
jgi:hypothetical protein